MEDGLRLAASLDQRLGFLGALGWDKLDEASDVCSASVVEGGEVKVWAVSMVRELIERCSETQFLSHCLQWRSALVTALQSRVNVGGVREVTECVKRLVSRAHGLSVKDFAKTQLPPLIHPLLRLREAAPTLQSPVLACLSAIHHLYPSACKQHRAVLLRWGKEGLMNSDLSLCRESARLLVVLHSSPEHWTSLLTSSLSTLSNALLHFSHTLTQTTPLSDKLNLALPPSEPDRSLHLLQLISSHSRLLTYLLLLLLLTPHPSPLTLPLSTLVGVVSFGLHIDGREIVSMATDSSLLLSVLPVVWCSLLSLLHSLLTSSHTHTLPFTSIIDDIIIKQMTNEGGVVWRGCVIGALCAWVKVRGEGGRGDGFTSAAIQWLLQSSHAIQEHQLVVAGSVLMALGVVVEQCQVTISPSLLQEVWQRAVDVLSMPSPVPLTLAGVKLLQRCLEYPGSTPLSTTIKILQSHAHHTSSEVCDESRRGLSLCGLLLHPLGPPWLTGPPGTRGPNIRPPSDIPHLSTVQSMPLEIGGQQGAAPQPQTGGQQGAKNPAPQPQTGGQQGAGNPAPQPQITGGRKRRREAEEEAGPPVATPRIEGAITRGQSGTSSDNEAAAAVSMIRDVSMTSSQDNEVTGNQSVDHANTTSGVGDHTDGQSKTTSGVGDHTDGQSKTTSGVGDHTDSHTNTTSGVGDHTDGQSKTTSGVGDHADKQSKTTAGVGDHSETTLGVGGHSEGVPGGSGEGWRRREESDDSDIEAIIATFCSSPSHTDSDDNSS